MFKFFSKKIEEPDDPEHTRYLATKILIDDLALLVNGKFGGSYLACYISHPSEHWTGKLSNGAYHHLHWQCMNEIAQRLAVRRINYDKVG